MTALGALINAVGLWPVLAVLAGAWALEPWIAGRIGKLTRPTTTRRSLARH
jgi:hypothetical protein